MIQQKLSKTKTFFITKLSLVCVGRAEEERVSVIEVQFGRHTVRLRPARGLQHDV